MSKHLEVTINELDKAADWLEKYKRRMLSKADGLVNKMLRDGEDYAINAVGHFDTGETVSSVLGYRDGNRGILKVGGNAIWIEFGTGVAYNGDGYNHPKAQELGMDAHGTFGQGKGANENGWYYFDEMDGAVHHTRGIPANMFMYNTAQMLRREYAKMAKEIFSK